MLSRELAAAYVGVSPNTFNAEVKDGKWPKPTRRGRRVTWDRSALDRRIDELYGARPSGRDIVRERLGDAVARETRQTH